MTFDLVLRGGHVIDPAHASNGVCDVAFKEGRVAAVGPNLSAHGARIHDVAGKIVTPGLIDLHTHVYWGGTSIGVDAEPLARSGAVATFIDAGTAGAGNILGFRKHVIERTAPRILAYLNISFPGIYAFSQRVMVGECADIRLLDPVECVEAARKHADLIVGVKVRIGRGASGESGLAPLDMAIETAEALGLPVMAHIDHPPPARIDVLARLRKGDVLTHCFRPFPNAPVDGAGRPHREVLAARERGVIFDVGHGGGSFGFGTARAMLAAGFEPDVISSDVHILSIDGPAFDLLTTMSKFMALGMKLDRVIEAATIAPAKAIRRPDLGSLAVGNPGDASILEIIDGTFDYRDVLGEVHVGTQRLVAAGLVLGGKVWHPA